MKPEDCAKRTHKRQYLYNCEHKGSKGAEDCQHYFNSECTLFVSGDSCPFQRDGGSLANLLNKLMGGQG